MKFKCKYCDKEFDNDKALFSHESDQHPYYNEDYELSFLASTANNMYARYCQFRKCEECRFTKNNHGCPLNIIKFAVDKEINDKNLNIKPWANQKDFAWAVKVGMVK